MSRKGFIKIDRKIDGWIYRYDSKRLGFWLHLLLSAEWKGEESGTVVTSLNDLVKQTKYEKKTVLKYLAELENLGQITRESGPRGTVIHILKYDQYQKGSAGREFHHSEKELVGNSTTAGREFHHSEKELVGNSTTAGREFHHFEDSTSLLNRRTEEYIDIKNINNASSESDAPEIIDNTDAWFREFWKVYPKHKAKTAAEKSFRRKCNTAEDFDTIMTGLRSVIENEWKNRDPQYIPYPTTWLNQERWNDEVTPRQKSLDERLMEEHLKNEQGRNNEDPADNPFGVPWD